MPAATRSRAAVQGLGKDTEAVGGEPRLELDDSQEQRPEQRREGRVLFSECASWCAVSGSHENTPGNGRPFAAVHGKSVRASAQYAVLIKDFQADADKDAAAHKFGASAKNVRMCEPFSRQQAKGRDDGTDHANQGGAAPIRLC